MTTQPTGSVTSYVFGFLFSLILTLVSYLVAVRQFGLPVEVLVAIVMVLAVVQLFVQSVFFLHLGHEAAPRWNLAFFIGALGVIVMVVVGSLWIMANLDHNMNPKAYSEYILHKEKIHLK